MAVDEKQPVARWQGLDWAQAATLEAHWRDFCRARKQDKAKMLCSQVQSNTQLGAVLVGSDFAEAVTKAVSDIESAAWSLTLGMALAKYEQWLDDELDEYMATEMLRGAMTSKAITAKYKPTLPALPSKQTAFKQMAWRSGRLIVRTQQGEWVDYAMHPLAASVSEDIDQPSLLKDEDIAQFGVQGLAGKPTASSGYTAAQFLLKQGFVYAQSSQPESR